VQEFNADAPWRARLLEPAELWGVESVTGAEAMVRTVFRAKPGPAAEEAARELRRRLHGALWDKGIATEPSAGIAGGAGATMPDAEVAGSSATRPAAGGGSAAPRPGAAGGEEPVSS